MKTNDTVELVILLQGNYVVVSLPKTIEKRTEVNDMIVDVMRKSFIDPLVYLGLGDYMIMGKYIIGWYWREPIINTADKLIKFMDKKLPNDSGDESWKHDDDAEDNK